MRYDTRHQRRLTFSEVHSSFDSSDINPGIVNPKIGDDVKFEINANFMRELRRKLFPGTDDKDTYKHVRTLLEIMDLFHFPGITHDAIMLRESGKRQGIQNEWMKKIMISTDLSLKNHDSSIKRLEQKVNHLAQLISTHNPNHTLMPKTETFGEKVKRRILEENKEPTTTHDKPKQQLQKVVSHEIKELHIHYSATLQNKLPPKETDPRSFILPCIIENHSMSNALANLGVSISVMPYSLFKRLGLGSLKPIKMTIKTADRSMKSPKGIKENVLVKISNFMFLVDFVVIDIMKDENVLIILGMPMLATAHVKIYVYDKMQELDDLVMNDEKVGDFENYLSPEYESQDIISLSPSELAEDKEDFSMTLCDPDKRMSIVLEEFVDIDDM
ncbi:putative reverse transcriptase, RNA-dependent DNA polymerase [Tanacetum coccineum]